MNTQMLMYDAIVVNLIRIVAILSKHHAEWTRLHALHI